MATKYISSITLPNGDVANLVDKSSGYTTNTGTVTGVQVDGTSVVNSNVANIKTSTAHPYNASSNVLATMGDIAAAGGGTVTSVGVSNATNGGLSVSGSPVTGSGTITVGHSNVLTSAQTTQAVYPIKIDKNGHISAYGAAATASDVGALADSGGEVTGDIVLKSEAGTNSPSIIFQRGTLTDNYNDWRIQDRGGYLYFEQRGSGSTDWSQEAMINTNGTITATTFSGNIAWSNVTGKPTFATVATSGSYNDLVDLPTIPTVPSAGTTATAVSTTSSGGSATTWSKSDHVHSISSSTITSALGYTPYDSTNPNGYTTNKGTVTSVTASGALSSSGGTTPAITHNAPSTSPAKSTQAVYPITIDSYGHITSAGSAVDIPSTNLIILDVSPNLSGDGYTVSFNSDSMSYTDACTAINNGEIVYIELNGSLGMGKYFEEADLFRIFGVDGAIDRITATFITNNITGTGSSTLSCNIVSDSSVTLTDLNLATSEDVSNVTSEAYMPREQPASNTDLNTILTPGCHTLDGTVTYTNSPMSGTSATLSVIKGSDNTVEQTFKAEDNSVHTYIRTSTDNGSTWTDWKEQGGYETYESWSSGSHDANSPKLGLVFCRNGSSYTTNLPDSGSYGYLLTQGRIGANCLQTYIGYSSSGVTSMYIRYYANSQWYPWVLIGPASYTDANNISY